MPKGQNLVRFLLAKKNMAPASQIASILRELMETKGLDAGKLADLTDVPQRFIVSLIGDNFKSLPSEPYIRGYLFKIAGILDADPHFLWRTFRQSAEVRSAGPTDVLPANRFSLKKMSSKKIWLILAALIFLAFIGFRLNSILGKPTLEISLPEATANQIVSVSGKVEPGDTLTLNNEVVYANERGEFVKEIQLEPGLNSLEFKVKRRLGRETKVMKQIFYQPQ